MPRRTTTKRTGRRTVLTAHRAEIITNAVRKGAHITTACQLAGINRATLYRWLERAEACENAINTGQPYDPEHEAFLDFRDALLTARAEGETFLTDVIWDDVAGGRLLSEEPVVDSDGKAQYDEEGRVLMKRTWSNANGRLALATLGRMAPDRWGDKGRVEVITADGAPAIIEAPEPGTDEAAAAPVESVLALAARMARTAQQRAEGYDDVDGIVDAEVVEDTEEAG